MKLFPLPVTFHLTFIDEVHFAPLRARIEARFRELLEKNCGLDANTLLFHARPSPNVKRNPELVGPPTHISYPQMDEVVLCVRYANREPEGVDVVFTTWKLCFFPLYDETGRVGPRDEPQDRTNGDLHNAHTRGVFLDPFPGCSSISIQFAMVPGDFFLSALDLEDPVDRDRAADAYVAIAGHEIFHILLSTTHHDESPRTDARVNRCLFSHVQGVTPMQVIAWADAMMARIDTVVCTDCCRGALSDDAFQRVQEYRSHLRALTSE